MEDTGLGDGFPKNDINPGKARTVRHDESDRARGHCHVSMPFKDRRWPGQAGSWAWGSGLELGLAAEWRQGLALGPSALHFFLLLDKGEYPQHPLWSSSPTCVAHGAHSSSVTTHGGGGWVTSSHRELLRGRLEDRQLREEAASPSGHWDVWGLGSGCVQPV